jgi:hypothetical protein
MQIWKKLCLRFLCSGLSVSLCSGAFMQAAAEQSVAPANQSLSVSASANDSSSRGVTLVASGEPNAAELPDSPGTVAARAASEPKEDASSPNGANEPVAQSTAQSTSSSSSTQNNSSSTPNSSAMPQNQPQTSTQKPVGTATADAPDSSGVAASQPAGVAIAPAKQKRTRTLVIKIGASVAAAVAVGTVVALTEATSSKPPGAH